MNGVFCGLNRGGGGGGKASGVKICTPSSPSHSALAKEAMLKKV